MKHIAIGIAGTAKNTGKTTTLFALMEALLQSGAVAPAQLALTSIGYDGERMDNVTGLPKPRIRVMEGMLTAVAQRCLRHSEAEVEVLQDTGIMTPMGTILLGRVRKGGLLVVAGPNKSGELARVLALLEQAGAAMSIVDGALGRIAPMVMVDGLILATGASRTQDLQRLALETESLLALLRLPVLQPKGAVAAFPSILGEKGFAALLRGLQEADTAAIQGVLSEELLWLLPGQGEALRGRRLLFPDSIKLLIASDLVRARRCIAQLAELGLEVGVQKRVHAIAVTVNPYYPKYNYGQGQEYAAAYVEQAALHAAIAGSVQTPCYDVVAQGAQALCADVLQFWSAAQ